MRIAHIFGGIFLFCFSFCDDFGRIPFTIGIKIIRMNDIDYLLSGELFILHSFGNLCLIGKCMNIRSKKPFFLNCLLNTIVGSNKIINKIRSTKLLYSIVAYEIHEVCAGKYKSYEDIMKTRIHNFACKVKSFSYNIQKS